MAAPYMGGFEITRIRYITQTELLIKFTTTYGSTYVYQAYRGRQLCGATSDVKDRALLALVPPADYPEPITVLAVTPGNRDTDYSASLPSSRPYTKAKFTIPTSGWTDADGIEITTGTSAGGAVDMASIIDEVLFDSNRAYTFITRPLDGTGTWNFEIAGRDTTAVDGNRGTAASAAVAIISHPRDVNLDANGDRFTYSVASQQLTVTYDLPS